MSANVAAPSHPISSKRRYGSSSASYTFRVRSSKSIPSSANCFFAANKSASGPISSSITASNAVSGRSRMASATKSDMSVSRRLCQDDFTSQSIARPSRTTRRSASAPGSSDSFVYPNQVGSTKIKERRARSHNADSTQTSERTL